MQKSCHFLRYAMEYHVDSTWTEHRAQPLNIIYDRHAEELLFPSIYYEIPRRFNMGVSVTANMIATSELRRRDRRGAAPQKILYVAMKILRLRMVDNTMADQPDEPMDLTDLPPPSTSNVTQDAAVSTSAMSVAEPPITAAPKSKAQKQRVYRQRIAASRTPAQVITARVAETARKRNYRLRVAANSTLADGSLQSTTASSSSATGRSTLAAEPVQTTVQPSTTSDLVEVQQAQSTWNAKWKLSIRRFKSTFLDNEFGCACSVCDRLWFKNL